MLKKYALALLAPHWRATLLVLSLGLVVSLLSAADPMVLKFLFDALAERKSEAIPAALGFLLVAEVGRAALTGLLSVKAWDVRLAVDLSLRDRLIRKLTTISTDYHQTEGA